MTKLSRKLLLSVLTVAFALITLGATTFAWFTLSTKAEVQTFNVDVTSGAGIEISADGSNYSNYISSQQVYAAITRAESSTVLDHVTSPDGINFNVIENNESFKKAQGGWTEFNLWFRSPEKNVEVYLLKQSKVSSPGMAWVSDANFSLSESKNMVVGESTTLYGANAVRISTTENPVASLVGDSFQYESGTEANVFELGGSDPSQNDQRLDKEIKDYGSVAYYNAKNPNAPLSEDTISTAQGNLPDVLAYENLPTIEMLNTDNIYNLDEDEEDEQTRLYTPVVTLKDSITTGATYYYGQITVRIWLEGWDPDMFNAIMADKISISLVFWGHSPSVLYEIEGVPTTLTLVKEDTELETFTFTVTVDGYEGEIQVTSSNEDAATAEIDTETSVVTVTAEDLGETVIRVYLEDYPHIYKTVAVSVVGQGG